MRREGKEPDLFKMLSHPIRRRILLTIGSRGHATFTDLSKIEPRAGLLYYHLNAMKALIVQDEKRRYRLSELGVKAYQMLLKEEYDIQETPALPPAKTPLALLTLFFQAITRPSVAVPTAVILMFPLSLVFSNSPFTPFLMFLVPLRPPVPVPLIFMLPLNCLLVFALTSLLTSAMYRIRITRIIYGILASSVLAHVPLAIFHILWQTLPHMQANEMLSMAVLTVLQVCGLWILIVGIRASAGISKRRAALPPLIIQYLGALFLLYFFP